MKEKFSVKVLAEIAIFAAIGFAIDLLEGGIFRGVWVNGGSIGIAMVPVFIIAYRRGLLPGLLCGLVLSAVKILSGGIYALPAASFDSKFMQVMGPFIQVSLDYVVAYTVVGFAGLFSGMYKRSKNANQRIIAVTFGVILGGLLKYAAHVAAGYFWLDSEITFWFGINGGTMLYSFVYNLYVVFSTIVCLPVMIIIAKVYPKFLNAYYVEEEKVEEEKAPAELQVECIESEDTKNEM